MPETFQEYAQRILALAEGLDPLAYLAATPARIGELIAGHAAADLQRAPAPGQWAVGPNAAHHRAGHVVGRANRRAPRRRGDRLCLSRPDDPVDAGNADPGVRPEHVGRVPARRA